ncbi:MAG: hypothetical protein ABI165_14340, partial [Bryobacteraceae bacterium]
MRKACADWLIAAATDSPNVEAIGELAFLAARIGSEQSIDPISRLVEMDALAERKMQNGESLRSRLLRALFGLLVTY